MLALETISLVKDALLLLDSKEQLETMIRTEIALLGQAKNLLISNRRCMTSGAG